MAKSNNSTVLDEVKALMKSLRDAKEAQLETIRKEQERIRDKIAEEALAIDEATAEMNAEKYEAARIRKGKAQTELEMYTARYIQIVQQEYITEEESDKTIDSLLEYEDSLAESFKAKAAEQLRKLDELLRDYLDEVHDTENTLYAWQQNIRANHKARDGAAYYDEAKGMHVHRSPDPIPVRRMKYSGCKEALQMEDYLKIAGAFYKG